MLRNIHIGKPLLSQTDILIIGGGILGCSAAYYLVKRGVSVTVVDRGLLANEATGATTAGLTLQNRAPMRFAVYRAAIAYWSTLTQELNTDLGYVKPGSLMVAHTGEEVACLEQRAEQLGGLGLNVQLLPASEAKQMAPWLSDEVARVAYCPDDGFAEPTLLPQAFVNSARHHGATFMTNTIVTSLRQAAKIGFVATTSQGEIRAQRIVNAAGAWAGQIATMLGVNLPITFNPLQAMMTEARPPWLDKVVLHAGRKLTLKQNREGRVVIGGGWRAQGQLNGRNKRLLPEHRAGNLAVAHQSVPKTADLKIEKEWVGIEGRSPDRLPFFGEVADVPGLYMLACVHGGFTLSPLLGDQLAELITENRTSFPMRKFTSQAFLPLTTKDMWTFINGS